MDSSELDYSKENIQPLKEGRLASYLSSALTAQCNAKSQSELLKEREKFELELRKYKGDDPLEVWYNYICWVTQAYPSNEVADLTTLIHKCLAKFKDDVRYHQDVRYVKLWIKCVEMQRDPFETYAMIHKHGIGSQCAEFYKSWAEEYEKVGNFKQATSIYAKGFEHGAQPLSELAQAKRNFEDRVARHLASKSEDEWMESNPDTEQRHALSALAPIKNGRSENVGSMRTGAAVFGPAGILKSHKGLQLQRKPEGIQIYSDQPVVETRNTVHLENVPLGRGVNRENIRKPGKWTNASAKRPAPTTTTTPLASVPFRMHEDPSSGTGMATPGGLCYSQKVFKQRKVEKDDFDCPLAIFESPDPTKKVMYCKEKVYSGGTEFSLEEIRAIKYFEAAEKEKQEMSKINDNNIMGEPYKEKQDSRSGHSLDLMEENQMSPPSNSFVTPKNGKQNENQGLPGGRHKGLSSYQPSPMQQFDFMSAPSPTINTRAANAMMNELFSSTFTQCLGDSLLVMPQEPQPNAPKFEIPSDADDNATFPDTPDQEERFSIPMPKAPPFSIHCTENILFEETPLNDENNCKPSGSQEVAKDWGAHIPYVPPPKDDENIGDGSDSSKENCSPDDYLPPAVKEKRTLAGILLPSKNVPFKPLGEEMDDEEADAKDIRQTERVMDDAGDNGATADVKMSPPSQKPAWETSFECEMLRCLNDVSTLEIPVKRRKEMSDDSEATLTCSKSYKSFSSLISQKSNGGILFKQTSTLRTVETEICTDSSSGYECLSKPLAKLPINNPMKGESVVNSMFVDRGLWGEGLSSQPLGALSGNSTESVEIVENPSDRNTLETLLGRVALPVSRSSNFYRITYCISYLKTNDVLNLRRGLKLTIQRVIGSIPDAKLFLAVNGEGESIVIKYQHISCEWEFYIVREIRSRLEDSRMFPAFSNILEGYLFNADSSMLLTKYLPNGTFLDLLNLYKKKHIVFPEVLVLFFTIDIVNTVRHLHRCSIIHGSIRPENLLVGDVPNVPQSRWNEEQFKGLLPVLQLINMDRCIDMTLFPTNVRFTSTSHEDQYQCIEMQNGKPWTYQIDLYGIAFTMHCMIFGEFMDISCQNGIWNINRKVPSHFNSGIWNNLFHSLLNVPSCDFIPDLQSIQAKLQEFMFTFEVDEFLSAITSMKKMLEERHTRESNRIRTFKCLT